MFDQEERMTETIAQFRVTPTLRKRLQRVADASVTRGVITDHVRMAVERYVENEERKHRLPPLAGAVQHNQPSLVME